MPGNESHTWALPIAKGPGVSKEAMERARKLGSPHKGAKSVSSGELSTGALSSPGGYKTQDFKRAI